MLLRYWQWTSGGAESGLPFGPLRYRAWTNGGAAPAVTSLPFGPLRYRAWTIGPDEVIVVPPTSPVIGTIPGPIRIRLPAALIEKDDEEIIAFLAALLQSRILH